MHKEFQPGRALVAGGAGFIGAHLCRRLLEDGHEVVCLDNFTTGREENVSALRKQARFQLLRHDVIDPLPDDVRPTHIYNLACPASPRHYQADPIQTFRSCVMGTHNLLECALRLGAPLLQASTSEVYGDPLVHPQSESYWGNVNPVGIRSCYDEGKRAAETLCMDYHRTRKADVKIARIFNTYGPGMAPDDGRLVSNLMQQALQGEDMTIYGDGSQTRSLCYVDDLVEGLVCLMYGADVPAGPFNLGNPEERTILEIARHIRRLTKTASRCVFFPLPQDDPVRRCPNITAARRYLHWQPRVGLECGLERTRDYFRDELAAVTAGSGSA